MTEKRVLSKKKKLIFSLISIFISILLTVTIGEIALRSLPIPGLKFDIAKIDTLTGGSFHSNSLNLYISDRGDVVRRKTNNWGYLDKNYTEKKEKGIFRIGFFGDSWTEARQVTLENTFHYQIENGLQDYNVETLSFGVSGYGTFQSYLEYKRWASFFDLDMIIYVFCENDIGDQIKSIKKSPYMPYPIVSDSIIIHDKSFFRRK